MTRAEFVDQVQDALNNLYDTPHLAGQPLAALLAGAQGVSLGQEVRRVLVNALRALRPAPGVPAQSPDWRRYRILELRYLEGLSPQEVMQRISLAKSQYYREQARILEMVADQLWEQAQARMAAPAAAAEPADVPSREALARTEVERLCASAEWQDVDLGRLLAGLKSVLVPLTQEKNVTLRFGELDTLIVPSADRVLLRQVLLTVVSQGLDLAVGGTITIESLDLDSGLRIVVEAGATAPQPPPRQGIGLEICRQLMAAMGGVLSVQTRPAQTPQTLLWEARLIWPAMTAPVLLVVDDNEYFHELFARYLAGYNWHVTGAASAAQARQKLAEIHPTVILLDVMMPREDGWELLRELRARPETATTPILVCSVLNQPEVAHALGASDYLLKPVTQQSLLQALAMWQRRAATPSPMHPT